MPSKTVHCSDAQCAEAAIYKIAAPWSDGAFTELKTYGHACSEHLGLVFREAEQRREAYVPLPSETIEEIGIYRYEQGKRDRHTADAQSGEQRRDIEAEIVERHQDHERPDEHAGENQCKNRQRQTGAPLPQRGQHAEGECDPQKYAGGFQLRARRLIPKRQRAPCSRHPDQQRRQQRGRDSQNACGSGVHDRALCQID